MTLCNARIARLWVTAAMAMLSSGCAMGASESAVCRVFPTRDYSREMQAQAAAELSTLPRGAALRVIVTDYGEWRERRRAVCR